MLENSLPLFGNTSAGANGLSQGENTDLHQNQTLLKVKGKDFENLIVLFFSIEIQE
jgi:hypothetical protein